MIRLSLIFATAILVASTTSGCVSPTQACSSYGYAPGTQAFAECSERHAAATSAYWQEQNRRNPLFVAPAPPATQTCQWVGNLWRCW